MYRDTHLVPVIQLYRSKWHDAAFYERQRRNREACLLMNKLPDEWEIGAHIEIHKDELNDTNCNRDSVVSRVSHPT